MNSNNNRIFSFWVFQAPLGYPCFQIGCVFVKYYLFNTTTFMQNCIYMNFRKNLTQFYINFSRQEHQIDVLYVSFNAWDSQVSFFTPFHFSFTFPLKRFWVSFSILRMQVDTSSGATMGGWTNFPPPSIFRHFLSFLHPLTPQAWSYCGPFLSNFAN